MIIQESFILRSQGGRNVMSFSELDKAFEAQDRSLAKGVRLNLFRHVIAEREINRLGVRSEGGARHQEAVRIEVERGG